MTTFDRKKIKQLREAKGLSWNRLGIELKTSATHVKKWEAGDSKPGMDSLERLCDFFKKTPSYFFVKKSAYKQNKR